MVTIHFENNTLIENIKFAPFQSDHAVFAHRTNRTFLLDPILLGNENLPCLFIRVLSFITSSSEAALYRGVVDNTPVVLKFAVWEDEAEGNLRKEAETYSIVSSKIPCQDQIVPKLYGLYAADSPDMTILGRCNLLMLVLEDCGNTLDLPLSAVPQHNKIVIFEMLGRFHQYTQSQTSEFDETYIICQAPGQYRLTVSHEMIDHECHFSGDWQLDKCFPDQAKLGCPHLYVAAFDAALWPLPEYEEVPESNIGDVSLSHMPPQNVVDQIVPKAILPSITAFPIFSRVLTLLRQIYKDYPNGDVPLKRIEEAKSAWINMGLPSTESEAEFQISQFEENPDLYPDVVDYCY